MNVISKKLVSVFVLLLAFNFSVNAEGDLTQQKAIDVLLEMGNKEGELKFFPSSLSFETGRLYRLTISNPSPHKHYFSSDKFSSAIFTRKVQINHSDGRAMVEVKGAIREVEVYPGSRVEWWFVALKSGQFNDLKCTIKGHYEAGMKANIVLH